MNARCDTINLHKHLYHKCPNKILKSTKRTCKDCGQYINCSLNIHYQHLELFASFHTFGVYEPITIYAEGEQQC